MRQLITIALLLTLLLPSTTSLGAAEAPKLPADAQKAVDKLDKAEAKLNQEHKRAVNSERAKAITDLQKAQKDITKSGDLDGALAVKKQIEALQAKISADEDTDLLGNKKKVDIAKLMPGSWTWQKTNGAAGTFEALADGTFVAKMTAPLAFPYIPGKWEAKDDQIVLTWLNDPAKVDTLAFTAPNKLAGDSHDAGKNSISATRQPPAEK
jgi:hypothetical protein